MSVLIIGPNEQAQIEAMMARARSHPITMAMVMAGRSNDTAVLELKDRKPGFERPASEHFELPGGYRIAYSVEQQPLGMCHHLSVSVTGRPKRGICPSPRAIEMICQAFGMSLPADKVWLEEFMPGEYAVNLVSVYAPGASGNA